MPAGLLVTVPLPVPALTTVKVFSVKVAVTDFAALIVIVHVPVPTQPAPVQPVKIESIAGATVSVTTVLLAYVSEQSEPQAMPVGLLVTMPLPVPALTTVNV